ILRVEQGIAKLGVDATEANLPQEARLSRALHFDKGCYLGQEIIARLHFKGHVNKILAGLKIENALPPQQGAPIFEGEKEAGKITSVIFSPKLNVWLALGYVPYASNEVGQEFSVGENKITALLTPLPISRA